ncbi:MAG: DnaD domain-containing protein [Erysipelotrichaceae bacterium]
MEISAIYNQPYFNRRNYILENVEHFSLHAEELILLLLIDYCNEYSKVISHAYLAEKLKKSLDEIDRLLDGLSNKGYLEIKMGNRQILFDISGIFKEQSVGKAFQSDLFELFEHEFGRTFSQLEMARMSEWMRLYEKQLIIYALREAVIYNKKGLDYIDRILQSWKERGLSVEDIESGKR